MNLTTSIPAQNSLISEFRAAFVRISNSLHKMRPYAISAAQEAIRGTDMSFSSFGTNPIAPRFLAVHFFAKKSIFFTNHENLAGFITTALGNSNQCELLTLGGTP